MSSHSEEAFDVSVIILEIRTFDLIGWDREKLRLLNILFANSGVSRRELAIGKLFQCKANGVECGKVDIAFMSGSVSDDWNGSSTNIEIGFSNNEKHFSFYKNIGISEKFGLILIDSAEQSHVQPFQVYNTTITVRTDIQLLCPNKPDIPIFTTIAPLAPINGNSDLLLKLGKIENEVATRKIAFAREPPFSYEHVVRPEFESLDERPTNNSKPSPVHERGFLYKFSWKTYGKVITRSGEYTVKCQPRVDTSKCDIGHWIRAKTHPRRRDAEILEYSGEFSKVQWEEWGTASRPTVCIDLYTDLIRHEKEQFRYYEHNCLGFIELNSDYFQVGKTKTSVRVMRRDTTFHLPIGPSLWFVCGIVPSNNE